MAKVSMCDRCLAPGHCCKELFLSNADGPFTVWAGTANETMERRGEPFRSLYRVDTFRTEGGALYETHAWYCPKLDKATGRCTIYDSRPQVCRDFEPMSGPLCVHYNGTENGEESYL